MERRRFVRPLPSVDRARQRSPSRPAQPAAQLDIARRSDGVAHGGHRFAPGQTSRTVRQARGAHVRSFRRHQGTRARSQDRGNRRRRAPSFRGGVRPDRFGGRRRAGRPGADATSGRRRQITFRPGHRRGIGAALFERMAKTDGGRAPGSGALTVPLAVDQPDAGNVRIIVGDWVPATDDAAVKAPFAITGGGIRLALARTLRNGRGRASPGAVARWIAALRDPCAAPRLISSYSARAFGPACVR